MCHSSFSRLLQDCVYVPHEPADHSEEIIRADEMRLGELEYVYGLVLFSESRSGISSCPADVVCQTIENGVVFVR
jgi:hypothetical protein